MRADDKAAAAWDDYVSQQQEEKIEELDRQLNAANESFRKLNIHALDLAARIQRLEEAGDAVAAIIGPPGSAHWADENQVDAAWNNWLKAKEAKP